MQFVFTISGLAVYFSLVILPVLNGYYAWRLFDKGWQKVALGFGLGLTTPFINYVIFYCLIIGIAGEDVFKGSVSNLSAISSHFATLAVCGGSTCWLYILAKRKKKRNQ